MMSDELKNRGGTKKYKVPNATEAIGKKLKEKRILLEYSLSDAGDYTGFPTSTIVKIENGFTADINYYVAYAQALYYPLPELFNIKIAYGPKYKLSAKKEARIFLTVNVKKLYTDDDFFIEPQSVNNVAIKLQELKVIDEINSLIRSRISGVLSTLVELGMLKVEKYKGRNHLYIKT